MEKEKFNKWTMLRDVVIFLTGFSVLAGAYIYGCG
jgi:hypothetical protein